MAFTSFRAGFCSNTWKRKTCSSHFISVFTARDITVLLLQNAVYFANKANKKIGEVLGKNRKVAAAKEDVDVRGLGNYLADQVQVVSDSEVIDLVFESDNIINM